MSIIRDNDKNHYAIRCDVCNCEINKNALFWELETYEDKPNDDICYNYENYDLCSEECLREIFEDYIIKSKEHKDKIICFNLNSAKGF